MKNRICASIFGLLLTTPLAFGQPSRMPAGPLPPVPAPQGPDLAQGPSLVAQPAPPSEPEETPPPKPAPSTNPTQHAQDAKPGLPADAKTFDPKDWPELLEQLPGTDHVSGPDHFSGPAVVPAYSQDGRRWDGPAVADNGPSRAARLAALVTGGNRVNVSRSEWGGPGVVQEMSTNPRPWAGPAVAPYEPPPRVRCVQSFFGWFHYSAREE
jgi:hypothetical protein